MTTARSRRAASAIAQYASADVFMRGLAAQDFAQLGGAFSADIRLRALLPRGPFEWTGAEVTAGQFARWFGDTENFELVEATVGEVGGRLHLHWRLRLQAERLGTGPGLGARRRSGPARPRISSRRSQSPACLIRSKPRRQR